jgi:hypothetical protein
MPPDELDLQELDRLTADRELSDAELEVIAAGKSPYGYGYGYGYGTRRYWSVGRIPYIGSFRGFSGFGRSLGSIGRGFAHVGRR